MPAQHRPDPRRQLCRREGLDDVVRRAGLERPDDGLVAAVARDEDHRQVGELRDGLHQLDAVGPGQHQVEQDQRGPLGADDVPERAMVAGDQRGIARLGQRVADMAQGLRIVVDHQDAVGLASLPGRRPAKGDAGAGGAGAHLPCHRGVECG